MNQRAPRTLLDKIWQAHLVEQRDNHPAVIYIDLHLIHEVTSPQAFSLLEARGLKVRRPDRTMATMDHSTPTEPPEGVFSNDPEARVQLQKLVQNCKTHGIALHEMGSRNHGIVHVIGPELGRTQPGMTIVCGDSHTSTHGAFGALAFGIGTSEVGHVLATQCLLQRKPGAFEVRLDGQLEAGASAKDIALALIAKIGTDGGTGYAFEFRGSGARALSMEERMTLCNMSIEGGARSGMVAPDDTTFAYLDGRPGAPQGADWDAALERWKTLPSDDGVAFERSVSLDLSALRPMVTFGTSPEMAIAVDEVVPDPATFGAKRELVAKALRYMQLTPGKALGESKVDVVFVGSCTNGRLSDLRDAARILDGRKVAEGVRMLVVPGSEQVKAEAESEGLDRIFTAAGAEWRMPGCSMCIAMNGDQVAPGKLAVSTSNRNFEGRQGPLSRTLLASPLTAAASAVKGHVCDPRTFLPSGSPTVGGAE
jgi:3-isopropylmalate/(R)-2-methylmalate dehydratase large subunit